MKHTQGEWTWNINNNDDKESNLTIFDNEKYPIAKADNNKMGRSLSEEIANAKLIASAPELLEILNLIILNEINLEKEGKACNISGPVYLKALQLINKATEE